MEKITERLMDDEPSVSLPVKIYTKEGPPRVVNQWVVEETPVTLFFNGEQMITLLCTGRHVDELAVGFFIAEGWIRERCALKEVIFNEKQGTVHITYEGTVGSREKFWLKRAITSGCAKGSLLCEVIDSLLEHPLGEQPKIEVFRIWDVMKKLNYLSDTFKKTHGVHNCALSEVNGEIVKLKDSTLLYRYDIGRHNALDMLIGRAFLEDLPLSDKIIVTTGRLTSEIVIKAAQAGIPILVSRHAATRLAVELAITLNLTLIGYVRANHITVYHDGGRLIE
ncbi:MAG: formate dehydrogenase accessory sulfurtransferase FdhD [Syntrophobacterales bacterium]|nr:formate dehydrogenase accessory sulfurtransferase FdhD [Syntrophobacterales bacterium]